MIEENPFDFIPYSVFYEIMSSPEGLEALECSNQHTKKDTDKFTRWEKVAIKLYAFLDIYDKEITVDDIKFAQSLWRKAAAYYKKSKLSSPPTQDQLTNLKPWIGVPKKFCNVMYPSNWYGSSLPSLLKREKEIKAPTDESMPTTSAAANYVLDQQSRRQENDMHEKSGENQIISPNTLAEENYSIKNEEKTKISQKEESNSIPAMSRKLRPESQASSVDANNNMTQSSQSTSCSFLPSLVPSLTSMSTGPQIFVLCPCSFKFQNCQDASRNDPNVTSPKILQVFPNNQLSSAGKTQENVVPISPVTQNSSISPTNEPSPSHQLREQEIIQENDLLKELPRVPETTSETILGKEEGKTIGNNEQVGEKSTVETSDDEERKFRLNFIKKFAKSVNEMSREDLAAIEKVAESMIFRSKYTKLLEKSGKQDEVIDNLKQKIHLITERHNEMETIHQTIVNDIIDRREQQSPSIKIMRNVGLQVCSEPNNSSNAITKTLPTIITKATISKKHLLPMLAKRANDSDINDPEAKRLKCNQVITIRRPLPMKEAAAIEKLEEVRVKIIKNDFPQKVIVSNISPTISKLIAKNNLLPGTSAQQPTASVTVQKNLINPAVIQKIKSIISDRPSANENSK